ncbi:MAG: hypothetical protein V4541_05385 [Bacteroidota bacterium]
MAKKKEVNPRADKYEEKAAVKGTFEDMIKASFAKDKPKKNK